MSQAKESPSPPAGAEAATEGGGPITRGRERGRPDDGDLARRVMQGDRPAFATLYDRYAGVVYSVAVHMVGQGEAEEAVQDIFLRFWERADQFDEARGSFRVWLMSVCRNHLLDRLRHLGVSRRVEIATSIEDILATSYEPREAQVEDLAWRQERAEAVVAALAGIPIEQRGALVLAYFGGLSQSEIAEQTGVALGTVKTRIRLGLKKLKAALEAKGLGA